MQRMPEREHHVVGDIHDVVDRAQANCLQPARNFHGRRFDRDATNRERRVAVAHLGNVDSDLH